MQIEKLIKSMKRRLRMYVKEEKIDYIEHFLLGYNGACHQFSSDEMDKKFSCWFTYWLLDWIETNIDNNYIAQSISIADNLMRITNSEREAIDLFFELCDLFFDDYRKGSGYFSDINN